MSSFVIMCYKLIRKKGRLRPACNASLTETVILISAAEADFVEIVKLQGYPKLIAELQVNRHC